MRAIIKVQGSVHSFKDYKRGDLVVLSSAGMTRMMEDSLSGKRRISHDLVEKLSALIGQVGVVEQSFTQSYEITVHFPGGRFVLRGDHVDPV